MTLCTINIKLYATGSSQPSFPDDEKLRLFSMRFCPFAHRILLVLTAKDIPYHVFNINLTEKPEWYLKLNPNGKVPAIQITGHPNEPVLIESMIIAEYLDEKYPQVKLFPNDPLKKAQTKLWVESFTPIIPVVSRLMYSQNSDDEIDKQLGTLYAELEKFNTKLAESGTPYFGGDKPGILDFAIWPWFERFGVVKENVGDKFHFDAKFPALVRIFNFE